MKKTPPLYALALNPALDLSGHVKSIVPNEKNYVFKARVDPGGNSINAARIARRLGVSPLILGFLGGPTGRQFEALLQKEGLKTSMTPIRAETRTNVTVTLDQTGAQTRLTFPGPRVRQQEIQSLLRSLRRLKGPGLFILGGSLPSGHKPDLYVKLINVITKQGFRVIFDAPSPVLKTVLRASKKRLLFIKPNLVELEELIQKKLGNIGAIVRAALQLNRNCDYVCVSLGKEGAILASQGRAWLIQSPHVKRRGTVGAGDSLVGATAARYLLKGFSQLSPDSDSRLMIEALRWGVAAGAATATTEGTSLGKASVVKRLFPKCRAKELIKF